VSPTDLGRDPIEQPSPRDRIAALLASIADALGGVGITFGATLEYRRDGALFATLGVAGFEVLLGEDIAGAAIRTSDTERSERGAGWIRFAPRHIDRFATDRAGSWFEAAWRRAGESEGAAR
jgi:hypothetical protein